MKRLFFFIIMVATFLVNAPHVWAVEDFFVLNVYIESADENINAYGTSLILPDSWSVDQLILNGSEFIFWIETPKQPSNGEMYFSGIFPGGVYNLRNYSSPLLLFSIEVEGDPELAEDTIFSDTEIYLNHPMALIAENAHFMYQIEDAIGNTPTEGLSWDNLDYSFVTDPVNGLLSLVIDNYSGLSASYLFKVKEGDSWTGDWVETYGRTYLESGTSTISLLALSPNGESEKFILRRSSMRIICITFVVSCGIFAVFYLLRKINKI